MFITNETTRNYEARLFNKKLRNIKINLVRVLSYEIKRKIEIKN